jgi:hypothetical protein
VHSLPLLWVEGAVVALAELGGTLEAGAATLFD